MGRVQALSSSSGSGNGLPSGVYFAFRVLHSVHRRVVSLLALQLPRDKVLEARDKLFLGDLAVSVNVKLLNDALDARGIDALVGSWL